MNRTEKILKLIHKIDPTEPSHLRKRGIKLKQCGEGCFRITYKIVGVPLVIKFPIYSRYGSADNLEHSIEEILFLDKVEEESRYKPIRRYMPKVYYANKRTGVIVMKYYKVPWKNVPERRLQKAINKHTGNKWGGDIYAGNIGYELTPSKRKAWKVIDVGLLFFD